MVVLIPAIWYLGMRFGMQRSTTTIVMAAIAGLAILLLVVAVLFRRRKTELPAAQEQPQVQEPASKPQEASVLGERLAGAIQWLRKSKLAEAGRDPVYELPWYLVMGQLGSGKSTLIAQSGFAFPYTDPKKTLAKLSISPTEDCDLWVSNEAVFIDPSGTYFSGIHPLKDWQHALDLIKLQRKMKPIDGIVLVVDVAEILRLDLDGLRERADRLRSFLDMTAHELGMVLPIYLLFNKSDLIEGFREFAGASEDCKNPALGATFRREQYQNPNPETVFEQEFETIYRSSLFRRVLGPPTRIEQNQEKIFAFPTQFLLTKDRLRDFIGILFRLNQFRERPLLRGFYFTSSVVSGRSLDPVGDLMQAKTGLPKAPESDRPLEATSSYVHPLFTQIIIPDRNLAGLSPAVRRRRRRVRMAAVACAAMVLPVVLMALVFGAYRDNLNLIYAIQAAQSIASQDGRTTENLSALNNVKESIENLECLGQTSACIRHGRRFHWGLYAGEAALTEARKVYLSQLKVLFLDPMLNGDVRLGHKFNGLKTQLRLMVSPAVGQTGATEQKEFNPGQAYALLKAYLMFSTVAKADPAFMLEQTRAYWIRGVQEKDQPMALELLRYYAHQLGDHRNPAYTLPRSTADDELVDRVRKQLLVVEPDRYYYDIIRQEGAAKVNSITLAGILGGKNLSIFSGGSTVNGTFTKVGWDTLVKDRILEMKRDYEQERSWVLGTSATAPGEAGIDSKLRASYFRDYQDGWWSFLKSVRLANFVNFQDASQKLEILCDTRESPLANVLSTVAMQTWKDLDPGKLKEIESRKERDDTALAERLEVARNFQSLHNFVQQKDKEESPLTQYLKALSRLQVVIRSFLDANQPAAQIGEIGRASEAALQVTNGLLVSFDGNSRPALEPILKQPVQNLLSIVDRSTPVGSVKDERTRSLTVGGLVKEKGRNLAGANVSLLEPYSDSKYLANKEIMRTQTADGVFQFSSAINPGPFKICVCKKGDTNYFCTDIRLGIESNGKVLQLQRPRSMLIFGGGSIDVTLRVK